MRRLLIMVARVLGPILLTRLMRRKKTKRPLTDEHEQNINTQTENNSEELIEH